MILRFRFLSMLLVFFAAQLHAAEEKHLVFAPLPMEHREMVLRQIVPMVHYLEQQTGIAFMIDYHTRYAAILDAFRQNRLDLAFLGPLPYVKLREADADAEPVVRFLDSHGSDTYTCSIITATESPFTSLQDLQGKRIALTQPDSTCGYLCTSHLFERAGVVIAATRYRYIHSHEEVALGVVRGEFDAGGIKTSIGDKYKHLGLRSLAESEPLPGFLLVANKSTVSEKQLKRIRGALLALRPLHSDQDRKVTQSWGKEVKYGAIEVNDADYDVIRSTLRGIEIPEQGNF